MPRCHRCNINFRTRQNLVQHLESSHPSVSSSSMVVPTVYDLIVMVGCPRQTLFCPHPYCLFMVKEVASTRTLARHFRKKHPDHDLQIKYKCEQCDIFIDPDRRADHIREHLDYVNCPNTSSTDYGNVSLMASADESLHADCPDSPRAVGLTLAPKRPYLLPLVDSSQSLAVPDSPKAIQSSPKSQLPPTQSSIPSDIVASSRGSLELVSRTSSCTSSPEVPSDIRELSPSPLVQSTPNVFSGRSSCSSSPSTKDPPELGTPSSSFSASHHECDKALICSQDVKDPSPSKFVTDEHVPVKSEFVRRLVTPPTPELLKTSLRQRSTPASPISLSPNDSPSGMRQLLDSPSECLATSPLHIPTSAVSSPSVVPVGDIRQVINDQSDTSRVLLPYNELRHKIGKERRDVYLKDNMLRSNGNVNAVGANSRIPGVAIASSRLDIACNVRDGSRTKAVVSTVNVDISCDDDNNGAVSDNVETVVIRDDEDLAWKRYADNAANALGVLKQVFRGAESSDSQPPVSPQELRGPTTSAQCIVVPQSFLKIRVSPLAYLLQSPPPPFL